MTNPVDLITAEYRDLIETASLDWQVAQYVRLDRTLHLHSANEVKAAAIAAIATEQHGDAFWSAVNNY